MAEPLAVDPARLIVAGSKLVDLVFPTLPAPIAATGSDPVSGAINATMPGIESLVSDGLPGVNAALKRTATSMSTAADIYAKADQSLGNALTQYQFSSDGQTPGSGGAAGAAASRTGQTAQSLATGGVAGAAASLAGQSAQSLAAPAANLMGAPADAVSQVSQAVSAKADELAPRVAATVPQVVQLAPQAGQMAQQASPIAQTISQSAQQAGSQGAGATPAQLASDTKPEQQGQLVDDTKKDGDNEDQTAGDDGAAAGAATLVSAPVHAATGGSASSGSVAAPV
ncbi:hypothetical protein B1987_19800 [Mycobacterium kansasii]|uniref:ESX-1 secretion-associated protein EspJ n=1 Tax=Mycobacterium attenuatum TaxID=2341086 RepID=A0A498QHN5_9MYCO|nr:hypothetical protein [Mycobacterium attenuatum]ORB85663.1 hypothetical protein B1987_19800 [Mycobacterium kansasii]VBA44254.1 ESX-1 secretion-associated protein EspJ [Mycobacterium attenuatum]VBA60356.1 ESX-1 secretion-associated protein EspJ [Mycobacterium attenuatum]VBA62266.1 ESX-1 secretion-associated protein EspJ [Mycobacterium attenuatum]